MGEPAVEPLAEMLGSRDARARRNAAEALGWIGSPAATVALVEALQDPSMPVREQAAWALGEIGDPAARAALARAQDRDPSAPVQAEATAALARIEASPVSVPRWPTTWAPALQRLQALRWSLLALFLAGAIWLVAGPRTLQALPTLQWNRRH
jgi:HEAT repeat protein